MLNPSLPWEAGRSSRPRLLTRAAIACITGYQRHLSPHKGFVCAHRVRHQGDSCSQYAKRVLQEEGLRAAGTKVPVRFAECRDAYLALRAEGIDTVAFDGGGLTILGTTLPQAAGFCIPTPIGCCWVSG